jgi:CHAT domain-containing protein
MKYFLTFLFLNILTIAFSQSDYPILIKELVRKGLAEEAQNQVSLYLQDNLPGSSVSDPSCAARLNIAGEIFLNSKFKEKALPYFLREKDILEINNQKNTDSYITVWQNLGKVYYRLAKFPEAQDHFVKALLLAKKLRGEKSPQFSTVLTDLANLFISKGNFLLAEKMFEKNAGICKELFGKESVEYAINIEEIGYITQVKGDYAAAEVYFQMAEKIFQDKKGFYSFEYARNMLLQGELYYELGQYTAAEALLRKAIHVFHSTKNHSSPEAMQALQHLAVLNLELSNESQANELLNITRNFNREYYTEMHPEYGKSVRELGKVYLQAGYPKAAEPFLNEAKAIFDSILTRKHFEYTLTLSELAQVYKSEGDLKTAEQLYVSALDTFRLTMGDHSAGYAHLLADLGNLYYKAGDYEKAIGMHQQAIELRKEILDNIHPDYIESTKDLSVVYWAAGKHNLAAGYFRKGGKNFIGQYQRYFAFLSEKEKTGFNEQIQNFFLKHNNFVISRMQKDPGLLGEMFDNQIATKSILFHTTKEIRDNIFGADSALVDKYHRWIRYKEILSKLYKLERDEIEKRGLLLDSLEETTNYLEKDISLRVELANKKGEDHILSTSWKDIRAKLTEGEAAIEMVRFNEFLPDSGGIMTDRIYYAALIVTRNTVHHPEIVLLDNGKELEGKYLNYYRNAIQLNLADNFSYNMFWKPVSECSALQGIRKIYFAADGVYNQINLNTLLNTATGKYALDETDVHVVSNTRDIHEIKMAKVPDTRLSPALLIGYPKYDLVTKHEHSEKVSAAGLERGGDTHLHVRGGANEIFRGGHQIAELPGTKIEVNSISDIFRKHNEPFEMYLGEEAVEERIKDDKHFYHPPRILHIATHGFFLEDNKKTGNLNESDLSRSTFIDSIILNRNNNNPLLQAGIMLAGASHAYSDETLLEEIYAIINKQELEDGILTAYEAMNLNLNETELVVLSACETGLGVVKNGEGVYGLQRAFQTAGANSVIMSLWKVNDDATQKFMRVFYEVWFTTKNKREAFRQAQIAIREEYKNPKYWGAFVLIGE